MQCKLKPDCYPRYVALLFDLDYLRSFLGWLRLSCHSPAEVFSCKGGIICVRIPSLSNCITEGWQESALSQETAVAKWEWCM